jgi:hypothetical protein
MNESLLVKRLQHTVDEAIAMWSACMKANTPIRQACIEIYIATGYSPWEYSVHTWSKHEKETFIKTAERALMFDTHGLDWRYRIDHE